MGAAYATAFDREVRLWRIERLVGQAQAPGTRWVTAWARTKLMFALATGMGNGGGGTHDRPGRRCRGTLAETRWWPTLPLRPGGLWAAPVPGHGGAFLGPLLAMLLMLLWANDIRAVSAAVVPAALHGVARPGGRN